MTEDDWIVEIDDYLRATNMTLNQFFNKKISDFKGIRYVSRQEMQYLFNDVKMPVNV